MTITESDEDAVEGASVVSLIYIGYKCTGQTDSQLQVQSCGAIDFSDFTHQSPGTALHYLCQIPCKGPLPQEIIPIIILKVDWDMGFQSVL